MIFGNVKNADLDDACVVIDGTEIQRVREIKYLGFILDDRLNMKSHVEYISKKIAKKIGFMARISRMLPMAQRILIYKSIVAPHFEYCPSIVFQCGKNEISRLQKLQNRAMRIIIRCKKTTRVESMLEALCFLNVQQRIIYQTMIFVYRLKHKLLPTSMTEMVTYIGESHEYPVRNANDFRLAATNKQSTKRTVFHEGLQMFNDLPKNIKSENNFTTYKRLLIQHN